MLSEDIADSFELLLENRSPSRVVMPSSEMLPGASMQIVPVKDGQADAREVA